VGNLPFLFVKVFLQIETKTTAAGASREDLCFNRRIKTFPFWNQGTHVTEELNFGSPHLGYCNPVAISRRHFLSSSAASLPP